MNFDRLIKKMKTAERLDERAERKAKDRKAEEKKDKE